MLNRLSLKPGDIVDIRELRASERRLKASGLFLVDPTKGAVPKIVYSAAGVGRQGRRELASRPAGGTRAIIRAGRRSPRPSWPAGAAVPGADLPPLPPGERYADLNFRYDSREDCCSDQQPSRRRPPGGAVGLRAAPPPERRRSRRWRRRDHSRPVPRRRRRRLSPTPPEPFQCPAAPVAAAHGQFATRTAVRGRPARQYSARRRRADAQRYRPGLCHRSNRRRAGRAAGPPQRRRGRPAARHAAPRSTPIRRSRSPPAAVPPGAVPHPRHVPAGAPCRRHRCPPAVPSYRPPAPATGDRPLAPHCRRGDRCSAIRTPLSVPSHHGRTARAICRWTSTSKRRRPAG